MFLEQKDLQLLENSEFLIQKRIVSDKIVEVLASLKKEYKNTFDQLPSNHNIHNYITNYPKISKGENYRNLPYFILDYPRVFTKQETFAIRSMVLWGSFYSFTLHVSGNLQEKISRKLVSAKDQFDSYYICINDTPWEYHYEKSNYLLINNLEEKKFHTILQERPFLKLSIMHKLSTFNHLQSSGLSFVKKIFSLID